VFSFDDLLASPKKTTLWTVCGITAARNNLRAMRREISFLLPLVGGAAPSSASLKSKGSLPDPPRWIRRVTNSTREQGGRAELVMVDIRAVGRCLAPVTIDEVKSTKSLSNMALVRSAGYGAARDAGGVGDDSSGWRREKRATR